MDLPIAPQTYRPSADALVRAIKRVEVMLARMVADELALDFATIFTHADRRAVHLANFAADVRAAEGRSPSQVFDAIDEAFAEVGTSCHRLIASETAWPADLASEAQSRGYVESARDLLLLQNYSPPATLHESLQIIPARASYPQMRAFYQQMATDLHQLDQEGAKALAATRIDHLDEPRIEAFLGRIDGEAVGVVSLVTLGQIGVIENLYVQPTVRKQGIGATLLAHALEHCRRALFEQVILEVAADNIHAQRLYAKLGFKPATQFSYYQRADQQRSR